MGYMMKITHPTEAFRTAGQLSNDYFDGKIALEIYRLQFLKCYLSFSDVEVRAVASMFMELPDGEG
jgi:hypothetical protein